MISQQSFHDTQITYCTRCRRADINLRDEGGQTPLFVASQRGHCDVLKCLLSSGADINLRDEVGRSPLFVASYHEHFDVVKCLLSSGADIYLPTFITQIDICTTIN
jgi:ankyrin repeat protein